MKAGWIILALVVLGAYSGDMAGEYGGKECLFHLHFTPGGRVVIQTPGGQTAGTYVVKGAQVIVTASEEEHIVFTHTAAGLVAELGPFGTITCKKL